MAASRGAGSPSLLITTSFRRFHVPWEPGPGAKNREWEGLRFLDFSPRKSKLVQRRENVENMGKFNWALELR